MRYKISMSSRNVFKHVALWLWRHSQRWTGTTVHMEALWQLACCSETSEPAQEYANSAKSK
jgi:hypothetical protein